MTRDKINGILDTEEKRHVEAFMTLVRLFETIHVDNIKILKALICGKEDPLPLFHCPTKQRVNLIAD